MTNDQRDWFLGLLAEFKNEYDRSPNLEDWEEFIVRKGVFRERRKRGSGGLLGLSLKASTCLIAYHLN
jgi:hypothetical protein